MYGSRLSLLMNCCIVALFLYISERTLACDQRTRPVIVDFFVLSTMLTPKVIKVSIRSPKATCYIQQSSQAGDLVPQR